MKVLLKLSRPTSMKNTRFTVGWSQVIPATMQVRECVVRGGLGSLPRNASEIPSGAKKARFITQRSPF